MSSSVCTISWIVICLVYLVRPVYLSSLVHFIEQSDQQDKRNKPDKPNKPNHPARPTRNSILILLKSSNVAPASLQSWLTHTPDQESFGSGSAAE
jgi:hypothetical protein